MFRPAVEDDATLLPGRAFRTIHFGAVLVIVRLTISERSCIIGSRKHSGCARAVAIHFFQRLAPHAEARPTPGEIPNSPTKARPGLHSRKRTPRSPGATIADC